MKLKQSTLLTATLLAALATNSQAADLIWDGGAGDFVYSSANNWDPDQAPATVSPYDNVTFSTTTAGERSLWMPGPSAC